MTIRLVSLFLGVYALALALSAFPTNAATGFGRDQKEYCLKLELIYLFHVRRIASYSPKYIGPRPFDSRC
jgi:hypothetical protein